jgi:hypothetical protein
MGLDYLARVVLLAGNYGSFIVYRRGPSNLFVAWLAYCMMMMTEIGDDGGFV